MAEVISKKVAELLEKIKEWEVRKKKAEDQLEAIIYEGDEIGEEILGLQRPDRMELREELDGQIPQNYFWMTVEFSKFNLP